MSNKQNSPQKFLPRRPTIGVLVGWQVYSGTFDSFLDRVFHGIRAAANERECNLMLACGTGLPYGVGFGKPAWPDHSAQVTFIPVGPWNCDGLIVLPPIGTARQAEYIADLVQQNFPIVFSDEMETGSVVTVDNRSGMNQAVDHLVAHGHRRIGFISGRQGEIDGDSRVRQLAYLEGLQRHGIDFDPALMVDGYHSLFGGRLAAQQLLERKVDFTAVIGSNDESAIGCMQILQAAGYMIPQDVAVIGFDDRIDARAQIPMLTSVHFPMFDLGYLAVQTLLKQIEGGISKPQKITIPTRLVIRESCGCIAGIAAKYDKTRKTEHPLAEDLSSDLRQERSSPTGEPDANLPLETLYDQLTQTIITAVSSEEYHLGLKEVDHLSRRLVEAFHNSLETGSSATFLLTLQQILARTSAQNDDLFTWHKVTIIMQDWLPQLIQPTTQLNNLSAVDMLIQARNTISEISQGLTARQTVRLESISNQLGEMSSCFFTAHNEDEIYDELIHRLPRLGILHGAVVSYYAGETDAFEWSELQTASFGLDHCHKRFLTRHFPPEGLFPKNQPFSIAILPIISAEENLGYAIFDTGNMPVCATIVQQLTASLRGIHLYREAIEARQIAEKGKRMAEEANLMKNRFLSWVIHELRTPLNLIYGLSDMLLQENRHSADKEIIVVREDLERIHIGSEHLMNLIRDVLDLASSELGQLKLLREILDLNVELRTTSTIGSQLAREKELVLRTEISDGLPAVYADRTRIRQIILNLINNAVKFTTQGVITLRADLVGKFVMISVEDTGLGIPPGEQDRIFEEFQQSERTSARGFGGLGLGLAICKRLVEMHEGEIGVLSSGEEGKGSTFYFTLPAVNAQPEIRNSPTQVIQTNKLLLLVNELPDGHEIKKQLDLRGFDTELFQIRTEIDWLGKVLLSQPQAVVLDLGLASRLGWEILKILKENPATQDVPVMFCKLEEKGEHGAMLELDYITKPIGSAELNRVLLSRGFGSGDSPTNPQKTILIVDDDVDTINLHSRMVQNHYPNCRIIPARNGREALQAITQQHPDLVLLDLLMPELDGFGVIEKMQQDEMSRNTPVIVLTGQALTAEEMSRLNCGVTSVLSKGMYRADETLKYIDDALARRHRAGTETQRVVLKAMAYLHTNYSAPITRKDVADYVGLSERHLTRCFNQEIGLTPMIYLNRYRVKQAKELLKAGRGSISDIAEIVGFSSGGYFTRVFRDEVGQSPRDFIRGKETNS